MLIPRFANLSLKLDIEELAPVKGIILAEYTLKAHPRKKNPKPYIPKARLKKQFKVTQTIFPVRNFREVNRKVNVLGGFVE